MKRRKPALNIENIVHEHHLRILNSKFSVKYGNRDESSLTKTGYSLQHEHRTYMRTVTHCHAHGLYASTSWLTFWCRLDGQPTMIIKVFIYASRCQYPKTVIRPFNFLTWNQAFTQRVKRKKIYQNKNRTVINRAFLNSKRSALYTNFPLYYSIKLDSDLFLCAIWMTVDFLAFNWKSERWTTIQIYR